MGKMELPAQKLEDVLAPLNSAQRQYICLRLIGMNPEEARVTLSRRPATIDRWLVEPNFRELEDFVVANRERFKGDALQVWATSLTAKARYFLEALIEEGLNQITKEHKDLGLLKLATTAAGLLNRISEPKTKEKGSYDNRVIEEFILRRQRPSE